MSFKSFKQKFLKAVLNQQLKQKKYSVVRSLLVHREKINPQAHDLSLKQNIKKDEFFNYLLNQYDVNGIKAYINQTTFLNLWGEIRSTIKKNHLEILQIVLNKTILDPHGVSFKFIGHELFLQDCLGCDLPIFNLISSISHQKISNPSLFDDIGNLAEEKWQKIIDLFLSYELNNSQQSACVISLFSQSINNPKLLDYLLKNEKDKRRVWELLKMDLGVEIFQNKNNLLYSKDFLRQLSKPHNPPSVAFETFKRIEVFFEIMALNEDFQDNNKAKIKIKTL